MSKDSTHEVCAEIVRLLGEERKRKRVSMNSLAAMAGLSQSLISGLEAKPWNPTVGTLLRIADALDVDLWGIHLQGTQDTWTTGQKELSGGCLTVSGESRRLPKGGLP